MNKISMLNTRTTSWNGSKHGMQLTYLEKSSTLNNLLNFYLLKTKKKLLRNPSSHKLKEINKIKLKFQKISNKAGINLLIKQRWVQYRLVS